MVSELALEESTFPNENFTGARGAELFVGAS